MIRRSFSFLLLIFVLVGCGRLNPYPAATPQPALATPTSNTEIDLPSFYEPDPTQPLKFQRLTVEDGLTQSTVYTIIQDQDGFLWFGTWDGLNRYDGKSLKKYRNNLQDANSLSNNTVMVLYVDRQGTLWVGTNGGLNKYDPLTDRFIRYLHDPDDPTSLANDRVGYLYEDTMGAFWVGTRGGGLDRLDRDTGTFSHYAHDPRVDGSLSDNYVTSVLETRTGELWVGTWGGLDRMNPLSGRFAHYRHKAEDPSTIASNLVQTLTVDDYGRLWIGTVEGGLDEYNPATRSFIHNTRSSTRTNSLSDNTIWEVMKDNEGDLWIGTNNGLTRLQTHSGRMIRYNYNPYDPEDAESLSQPVVSSVYQDRSGVYWFGTEGGGVNYFVPSTRIFQHYHTEPNDPRSLSSNIVWSFLKDRDGDLWVGTNNGLNRLDRIGRSFTHFFNDPLDPNSLSGNNVAVLYEDERENIWLGTDQGLCRYDRSTNHFVRYYRTASHGELTEPLPIPGPAIVSITPDANGNLLLGTSGEGFWVLNAGGSEVLPFTYQEQKLADLERSTIYTSLFDANGNLWIGTTPSIAHEGGLFRLDLTSGTLSRYLNNPTDRRTISNNTILSMHLDQAGNLWVGTAAGLNRFDAQTGVFRQYIEQAGLPNDVIYSIQDDQQGNLWVSTNDGISRFTPGSEIFKNFNNKDGLQSNEFNAASSYRDAVGQLYFGGINGFTVFNPEHVRSNTYVPPVIITGLSQGGLPLELNRPPEKLTQLTLRWPRNYFEFEYSALNYIHPEDNRYTYILEGFDRDWNMVGSQTFGRYTNLPGGSYVLRVRASNNDGVWNDVGTMLRVVVVPPLWEETWFQWAGGLLLMAVVFNLFRLRVRSMQKHNLELSQQVAERTREIDQRRKVAEGLRDILVQINSNRSLPETLTFIARQVSSLARPTHVFLFEIAKQNRVNVLASVFSTHFPAALPDQLSAPAVEYPPEVLEWFTYLVKSAAPREIADLPAALRHRFGT
ncbi:MAG: hypothetical protein HGA86_03145, partial [Anaerolineaceae bacterium]|nr:hypothetical protein [Anaerolineaceae bacterium]